MGLALLTLVPLFSIVFLVLKNGLPLLSWSVFTELPPAAGTAGGGFGNAVVGTFLMVGIALVLAAPFGILSAIYINEYDPFSPLANAVRFVAKLLTGIPSIICGVFAYAVIVLTTGGFSAWAGGFALAILILPTILLTAEQALLGVPKAYREASYGLGATNFQTIWRVVLPDAVPAIMTGIMLAVARAAGETAPLVFTALFSQYLDPIAPGADGIPLCPDLQFLNTPLRTSSQDGLDSVVGVSDSRHNREYYSAGRVPEEITRYGENYGFKNAANHLGNRDKRGAGFGLASDRLHQGD